jgi:hypothetical protein
VVVSIVMSQAWTQVWETLLASNSATSPNQATDLEALCECVLSADRSDRSASTSNGVAGASISVCGYRGGNDRVASAQAARPLSAFLLYATVPQPDASLSFQYIADYTQLANLARWGGVGTACQRQFSVVVPKPEGNDYEPHSKIHLV